MSILLWFLPEEIEDVEIPGFDPVITYLMPGPSPISLYGFNPRSTEIEYYGEYYRTLPIVRFDTSPYTLPFSPSIGVKSPLAPARRIP